MTVMGLESGRLLSDRYRLTELVAVGGMGEVWKAQDQMLEREVAIKALKREYADDETFLARFRAEAKHTAGLSHPGIAAVYDYGEDAGTSYLVMELVPGEALSAKIRREGRLDPITTLTIVGQAALALHAAHAAGVIHRDIKPGNLLITPDYTTKVTDFGIAWAAAAVPLTMTGTVLGTAHYLSPEQGTGAEVTPASDVYSLGVVAYECLAGSRPFDGDSAVRIAVAHVQDDPPPLPDDVPEDVRTLVAQAMAKDPSQRFTTAAAFARAVTATQQHLDGRLAPALASANAVPTAVIPLGNMPVSSGAPLLAPAAAAMTRLVGTRRPSRAALLLTLGAVFVLLLIAGAVTIARSPDERMLPSVAGLTLEKARATVENLDFTTRVTKEPSRTVPSGTVLRSDPQGPVSLRSGATVELVVSAGPAEVVLPLGLIGRPADEVVAELTRLGLKPTVRRVPTSAATAGTVTAITPNSGLRETNIVTVSVAAEPPPSDRGRGKDKDEEG